jgi:hypothetical protein
MKWTMKWAILAVSLVLGLSEFAVKASANPVISIGPKPQLCTPINLPNTQPFTIIVPAARCYTNGTATRFTDLEFSADPAQAANITGMGGTFFGNCPAGTTSTFACTMGATGSGIGPGVSFGISFTGFANNTTVTVTPSVPEPASIVLLGTGVLGFARLLYRRVRLA